MKQNIDVEQLEALSEEATEKLAEWFYNQPLSDDTYVQVYIPEEKDGEYGGVFEGEIGGNEFEFDYPEPRICDINHHEGTVLPLLSIGDMLQFLEGQGQLKDITVSSDICDALWEKVKAFFEDRENTEQPKESQPPMVTLRWIEDGKEHAFSSNDLEAVKAQYFCLVVGQTQGVVEKIMLPEIEGKL